MRIIIIGAFGSDRSKKGGEICKNRNFADFFELLRVQYRIINTSGWQYRPWIIVHILWIALVHPSDKILLSASSKSSNRIIRILKAFHAKNDIVYSVVGGSFHKFLSMGKYSVADYKRLRSILVQTFEMKETLEHMGLERVYYVPNSRVINYLVSSRHKYRDKIKFVFAAQIRPEKGCDVIIDAIKIINGRGFKDYYDVSFYGTIHQAYMKKFNKLISETPNASYRGVLDFTIDEGYDVLSSYDVMLFPTFWDGEGFPGVFIDAFIASLPIIASDWNFNKSIIGDGKCGYIVKPNDSESLAEKMMLIIEKPESLELFSKASHEMARKYDTRKVMNKQFMCEIGLIN